MYGVSVNYNMFKYVIINYSNMINKLQLISFINHYFE